MMTNIVSVVIKTELLDRIDKERADTSRSKFICRLVENWLMESKINDIINK